MAGGLDRLVAHARGDAWSDMEVGVDRCGRGCIAAFSVDAFSLGRSVVGNWVSPGCPADRGGPGSDLYTLSNTHVGAYLYATADFYVAADIDVDEHTDGDAGADEHADSDENSDKNADKGTDEDANSYSYCNCDQNADCRGCG